MATKDSKYRGTANPQYARDIAALRASGAAGLHQDRRTRRIRTRGAALAAALRQG